VEEIGQGSESAVLPSNLIPIQPKATSQQLISPCSWNFALPSPSESGMISKFQLHLLEAVMDFITIF
jgi:hypothetical protein